MINQSKKWIEQYIEKYGVEKFIEGIKKEYKELGEKVLRIKETIDFKDLVIEQKEEYIKELQIELNKLIYQGTKNILLQIETKEQFQVIPIKTISVNQKNISFIDAKSYKLNTLELKDVINYKILK